MFKHELAQTKGKKTSKQLADLEEKRSALIQQITGGVLYSPPRIPAGIRWNLGDSGNSAEWNFSSTAQYFTVPHRFHLESSNSTRMAPEWLDSSRTAPEWHQNSSQGTHK